MKKHHQPRAIRVTPSELALIRQMESRRQDREERLQAICGRAIDAMIAGLLFGLLIIAVYYVASFPAPEPVEAHTDSIVEGITR